MSAPRKRVLTKRTFGHKFFHCLATCGVDGDSWQSPHMTSDGRLRVQVHPRQNDEVRSLETRLDDETIT